MQHPGQLHVRRVHRLAARALAPVDTDRVAADDVARAGGPLVERVLLDDEPDLLVPALDLFLGADQSRHVRIASSIFGYAPQRQRFPAMRVPDLLGRRVGVRLDERDRAHDLPRRAEAALERVARTNASIIGWSRRPSIVVTSRTVDARARA